MLGCGLGWFIRFSIGLLDLGEAKFIDVGSKWGCWMHLGSGLELLSFFARLLNVEVVGVIVNCCCACCCHSFVDRC